MNITAKTMVAGVAGSPVRHSLSPLLHNAWLKQAGIDGVYVAFAPHQDAFPAFARGLRGGAIRGLNVTIPFKEQALALADTASDLARAAGAPDIRVCNRTAARAEQLVEALAGPAGATPLRAYDRADLAAVDAALVINATSLGLNGGPGPDMPWRLARPDAVVLDMVYRPLNTAFLQEAQAHGLRTVDGLEMLIRQAVPSFEAFYGVSPPDMDARSLLLAALETGG